MRMAVREKKKSGKALTRERKSFILHSLMTLQYVKMSKLKTLPNTDTRALRKKAKNVLYIIFIYAILAGSLNVLVAEKKNESALT